MTQKSYRFCKGAFRSEIRQTFRSTYHRCAGGGLDCTGCLSVVGLKYEVAAHDMASISYAHPTYSELLKDAYTIEHQEDHLYIFNYTLLTFRNMSQESGPQPVSSIPELWKFGNPQSETTYDVFAEEDLIYFKQAIPNDYLPNLEVVLLIENLKTVAFASVAEGSYVSSKQKAEHLVAQIEALGV